MLIARYGAQLRYVPLRAGASFLRPSRHASSWRQTPQRWTAKLLSHGPLVYVRWVLGTALAYHIGTGYFYDWEMTYGVSMLPTLAATGDGVIISKYYRRGRDVKVGDLVSFKHPIDEYSRALKRIVGMPGDFVLRDSPHRGRKMMMVQVPAGHCYLVGDNLNHSRDSRMYGPIPLALIVGKAVIRSQPTMFWLPWFTKIPDGLEDPEGDWEAEVPD